MKSIILILVGFLIFSCQATGPIDAEIEHAGELLKQASTLNIDTDREKGLELIAQADGILQNFEDAGAGLNPTQRDKIKKLVTDNQEMMLAYMLYSKP